MGRTRSVDISKRTGRPSKLSGDDLLVMVRMSQRGQSVRTIAKVLSRPDRIVSRETVGRWLRRAKTPNESLSTALASLRADAVTSWAQAMTVAGKQGKHTPARDLLASTGVIASNQPTDRLTIIVGTGTQVIGIVPAIPRELLNGPAIDTQVISQTAQANANTPHSPDSVDPIASPERHRDGNG